MIRQWKEKWNTRFREEEYVYGVGPNEFLKEQLESLKPGRILFPAEGEGRNAVYAATLGWQVSAFDISEEGKKKAIKLATENRVELDYKIGVLPELGYKKGEFDVIALIYAHFSPKIRPAYFQFLNSYLRRGGYIIFEAFGEHHLDYRNKNPRVGGPPRAELLFTRDEIKTAFPDYEFKILGEYEVQLDEGTGHVGVGSAIRCLAQKN